jgi:hypothetical protein
MIGLTRILAGRQEIMSGRPGSERSTAQSMLPEPRSGLSADVTFVRRLAHVDNIPQQDSAERAFNKLARTFACTAGDGGPLYLGTADA